MTRFIKNFYIIILITTQACTKIQSNIPIEYHTKSIYQKIIDIDTNIPKEKVTINNINDNLIYHKVQKGETLDGIAKKYSIPLQDIIKTNKITLPHKLIVDEIIKINKPINQNKHILIKNIKKEKIQQKKTFISPVAGKIITKFGDNTSYGKSYGIDILAKKNAPVKSISEGFIVHTGFDKIFGNIVIVKLTKHQDMYVAYAHLNKINFLPNRYVKRNDIIGYIGNTGDTKEYKLYLAIKKGLKPIDPLKWIEHN